MRRVPSALPSQLLLVVGLALAHAGATAAASNEGGDDRSSITGYAAWAEEVLESPPGGIHSFDQLEQRVLELAGERRKETGQDLAPLEVDPELSEVAKAHAIEMLQRGYTEHVGPDGRDVNDRIGILYRRFVGHVGENLAEHTGLGMDQLADQIGPLATKLVDGFMESERHRKNLLSDEYTHQGLAAAGQDERLVVVHVFGLRQAMLEEPLPVTASAAQELPLAFENGPELRVPQQYGFARPGESVDDIVSLDLSSNQVSVDPGRYRLKFFLPTDEEGLFDVADGPLLVVE